MYCDLLLEHDCLSVCSTTPHTPRSEYIPAMLRRGRHHDQPLLSPKELERGISPQHVYSPINLYCTRHALLYARGIECSCPPQRCCIPLPPTKLSQHSTQDRPNIGQAISFMSPPLVDEHAQIREMSRCLEYVPSYYWRAWCEQNKRWSR